MKEKVITIILAVISIIWIIIEGALSDDFFRWNHTFALKLQNGDTDPSSSKYTFFTIVSYLGQEEVIAVFVLIGIIFFANKIQALKLLITTMISVFFIDLLKLWYRQPRPYWVYTDLQGIGCDLEFGKPSGHAMVTSILFYLLFDSFVNRKFFNVPSTQLEIGQREQNVAQVIDMEDLSKKEIQDVEEGSTSRKGSNQELNSEGSVNDEQFLNSFLYLPIYLLLMFLVGFSRVILGAHTFSQVLVGWAYSILYIIVYRWKFEMLLEKALLMVTWKRSKNKKELYMILLGITLIYALSIGIIILCYYYADQAIPDGEKALYKANILNHSYCQSKFKQRKFLAGECLIDCGVLSIIYGVFISSLSLVGTYKPQSWSKNYRELSLLKKILRIIIIGLLVAIPYVAFSLYTITNEYLYFFFQSSVQYLTLAIFLVRLTPTFYHITKLEIEGDYLMSLPNSSFFDTPFKLNDQYEAT